MNVIVKLPGKDSSMQEWRKAISAARADTIESILHQGLLIWMFSDACPVESGGSTFTVEMGKLGYSPTAASRWLKIGGEHDKLLRSAQKLPTSVYSIFLLAGLPAKDIKQIASPEVTRDAIIEYSRRLAPPSKPGEPRMPPPKLPEFKVPDWARKKADEIDPFRRKLQSSPKVTPAQAMEVLTRFYLLTLDLNTLSGLKAAKRILSSAFHPDTGTLAAAHPGAMTDINAAFSVLEGARDEE